MLPDISITQSLSIPAVIQQFGSVANANRVYANNAASEPLLEPLLDIALPNSIGFGVNGLERAALQVSDILSNRTLPGLFTTGQIQSTGFLAQLIAQQIEADKVITAQPSPVAQEIPVPANQNIPLQTIQNQPSIPEFNLMVGIDAYRRVQALAAPVANDIEPVKKFTQEIPEQVAAYAAVQVVPGFADRRQQPQEFLTQRQNNFLFSGTNQVEEVVRSFSVANVVPDTRVRTKSSDFFI